MRPGSTSAARLARNLTLGPRRWLRSLERAEILERRTGPKGRTLDYRLTPAGRDLEAVVQAIGEWGVTWASPIPAPRSSTPTLDRLDGPPRRSRAASPDRTVVQFDFRDPAKRYWMVLEPSDVSVCLQHPGFDVDLAVTVDTATLYRVYLGRAELAGALRSRKLAMSGPRALQRGFGRCSPGVRSHPPAGGPMSAAAQRRDSRAPRGCGSNSRCQRILVPEHERGSAVREARIE